MPTPRLNLYLPLEMQEELKENAERLGINSSELVRRIISQWLELERQNANRNPSEFEAYTYEQLQTFTLKRFFELARYAISQETQVREIERLAKKEDISPEEWAIKNRGITTV